jgi:hypothetical protein
VRTRPKRGIRAGCPLGLFVWKDELPAIWALLDLRLIDIRPGGPVVLLAGIPGCDRLPGGDSRLIRVRDAREAGGRAPRKDVDLQVL